MSRRWVAAGLRLAASLIAAGASYFAWLAIFLSVRLNAPPWLGATFWLLTPVVTATGFAAGMAHAEHWTHAPERPQSWVVLFPLVACVLGAAIVYPFGPMLIVFGMCGLGAAAMGLLELLRAARDKRSPS